jgi:phosphoglycolate phosphatase/AHBA synthesis associated protein
MTTSPRAVLFDLDGVLVKSEETWFRVVEEAGRRFRGRPVTREEFEPTFGQGTEADVAAFGLGCTPEALNAFYVHAFPQFFDTMWINPEAQGVLAALKQRGLALALVTNTVTPLAHQIVERAGLHTFFTTLACADQVERAKPAPDLIVEACRRLGVSPSEAWMIGDSRYDRGAADAAGARFIGLGIEGDPRIERLSELLTLR